VVTKAGLTVVFIFTLFFLFFFSARQKIDEDLQLLDRQIRLQSGEEVRIEGETPARSLGRSHKISLTPFQEKIFHLFTFFIFIYSFYMNFLSQENINSMSKFTSNKDHITDNAKTSIQ
jgi:hypothetical protein